MPEGKSLVPSFGNWEMAADIPYTVVFDKARTVKDQKMVDWSNPDSYPQMYNRSLSESNTSGINSQCRNNSFHKVISPSMACTNPVKRSNMELDSLRKISDVHYANISSSSRRSTLEQPACHIQAESQYPAFNGLSVSQRSTSSNSSRQRIHSIGKRDVNEVLAHDERVYEPAAGQPASYYQDYTGRLSRRRVTPPRRERAMSDDLIGSYSVHSTPAKAQQQQLRNSNVEMLNRATLPRFGDWDANNPMSGDDFSIIFDRARDEKKSKGLQCSTLPPKAPPRADEDLYKPSMSRKSSNGIWSLLCCRHPSPTVL